MEPQLVRDPIVSCHSFIPDTNETSYLQDILVRDRYKLVRKINEGGYGVVYEGKEILAARSSMIHPADDRIKGLDTRLGRGVAIKLEHTFVSPSVVKREGPLYASLQHTPGFPHLYYVGDDCEYYLLVLELLGPSLEDLFNFCGRCFSLKTVAMIVDQLINRLQSLHSRELVHRDFKPENLLMGSGRQGNTIFVIDLGITGPPGGGPMGTLLFASMKAHTEEGIIFCILPAFSSRQKLLPLLHSDASQRAICVRRSGISRLHAHILSSRLSTLGPSKRMDSR
ncbi:hypothetical protein FH972_024163 [Carpinus fangiana]|uniref:non-specific serine/threonine protein kinase n=1 Tax=Carpinus fangiana TaxID=176857 RepID=A0A5N6KXN3_9ROSI|nr:hypothetical protein FH972_024163 [Carpinus fangiana]